MMRPLSSLDLHETAASGDLERMKATVRQAEEYLREVGDVTAALECLKLEIMKIERGR